jgi:hypothetical protein
MNIPGLSTPAILKMYYSIVEALVIDDNTPQGHDKPYGVRQFSDWKEQATAFEAELDKRKVSYDRIKW